MIRPFLIRTDIPLPQKNWNTNRHESSRIGTNERGDSSDHPRPIETTWITEIDNDADTQSSRSQIIEHLGFFALRYLLHCLEFHQNCGVTDEVCAERLLQDAVLELDAQGQLWLKWDSTVDHFQL